MGLNAISAHADSVLPWTKVADVKVESSPLPQCAQGIPKSSHHPLLRGLQWEQGVKFPVSTTEQTRWLQLIELLGMNSTLPQELLQEWFESPEQQLSHLWAITATGN